MEFPGSHTFNPFFSSSHSFHWHFSAAPKKKKKKKIMNQINYKKLFCLEAEYWLVNQIKINGKNIPGILTYHDNEYTDKNSNEISEKGQGMFHIVQIAKVSFLNYLLGVHYNVAHEHQQPKVQLQTIKRILENVICKNLYPIS